MALRRQAGTVDEVRILHAQLPGAVVHLLHKQFRAPRHMLGQRYRRLSGHYPYPKPILNTWILSVQQTTGVYSPFTVEANYNRDIAYYDIPFTICHELSHLRGYMQEEEANFIGVLATIGADDLYFNYSGYVSAWVYAGNALARIDSTAFAPNGTGATYDFLTISHDGTKGEVKVTLPLGTYEIREVTAPYGFTLSELVYTVTLGWDNQCNDLVLAQSITANGDTAKTRKKKRPSGRFSSCRKNRPAGSILTIR